MREFNIGEQEALLGLSLYVLACELNFGLTIVPVVTLANDVYRRPWPNAVGPNKRARLHRKKSSVCFNISRLLLLQYLSGNVGNLDRSTGYKVPASVLWQPMPRHRRCFYARSISRSYSPACSCCMDCSSVLRSGPRSVDSQQLGASQILEVGLMGNRMDGGTNSCVSHPATRD
jgi:hypothetical protein